MRVGATIIAISLMAVMSASVARAQPNAGVINGRLVRQDGSPLAGAMALVQSTGAVEFTGADDVYRFHRVPPGTQTVLLTLGSYSLVFTIQVAAGTSAEVHETVVDWPLSFVESMVVVAPSRKVESIAEAPAAVTVLDAREIERLSGQGQLPLALASAPGVQAAQAGLYDYSVNARGFNEMVNRRVRVEIDGRDASQPHVMGNTDWASIPQALGEFEQIEMVRGPAGALDRPGRHEWRAQLAIEEPGRQPGREGAVHVRGDWHGAD